jgi:hypothetical protein
LIDTHTTTDVVHRRPKQVAISTSHALEKLGKHYGAEHCITHPNLQPDFLVMAIIKSALAIVHMPDLEVVLME